MYDDGSTDHAAITMLDTKSLEPEESAQLLQAREWMKGHFTHDPEGKYQTVEGKLRVVDAILQNRWVLPTETWKLQALGVAFGDALAEALMLEWVTIIEENERYPALSWPGTSILSFPLTIISKRIEEGVEVDVYDLFSDKRSELCDMAFSGKIV